VSGRNHDGCEFSEEDEFSPRYCRRGQRHTPAAVLARNHGLCDECRAEREHQLALEVQRQERAAEEEHQAKEEARRRRYETSTGYGVCPACGSQNVDEFTSGGAEVDAQAAYACCSCLFISWPLALLAPFLFRKPITYHYRCNYCGHGWQG